MFIAVFSGPRPPAPAPPPGLNKVGRIVFALAGAMGWTGQANAAFVDATADAGLDYVQMGSIETTSTAHLQSGGAAAGDFDNDGWVDLFVTRFGERDILFRNLGPVGPDGAVRFADVTEAAGITGAYNSNGAAWADIDNDGDLDLYVTTMYHFRYYLYVNNGDGTFTERGIFLGADLRSNTPHNGFSVAFGDYDRDGFLDFFVCEWDIRKNVPDVSKHNVLMRNLGAPAPGFFSNRTAAAGVVLKGVELAEDPNFHFMFAFTSRFSDLDGDGWPDLLVTADYGSSQIFWNNGDGTFVDEGEVTGVGLETNGMGSDVGDFDGDGQLDWFVTSIDDNRLYRNLGNRRFEDVALTAGPPRGPDDPPNFGVAYAGWGWGTAFLDYDNDGDEDLVMTNGHEDRDRRLAILQSIDQTTFWRNDEGIYHRVSDEVGFTDSEPGKGLLTFDYDRDGDLDVFIANCQSKPILYRNDTVTANHWLRVRLVGWKSNANGVGARLELQARETGSVQVREISGGSHYLAQSEGTAHFGLGADLASVHALTVRWPSGRLQTLSHLPVDREIRVVEPASYEEWHARLSPRTVEPLGGREDDFDRDGFSNFLEYVFATNPRDERQVPDLGKMRPRLLRSAGEQRLRYARPLGAVDAAYLYESSQDLDTWAFVGSSTETQESPVSAEGDFLWVEGSLPVLGTPSFLRVRPVAAGESFNPLAPGG